MQSGYRNQTFVVPDAASQEGGLPLTVSTPKPHVSLWLPPNPTSARPVTPIPLLVSKHTAKFTVLAVSNTGKLDRTGKVDKNLRILNTPLR